MQLLSSFILCVNSFVDNASGCFRPKYIAIHHMVPPAQYIAFFQDFQRSTRHSAKRLSRHFPSTDQNALRFLPSGGQYMYLIDSLTPQASSSLTLLRLTYFKPLSTLSTHYIFL